MGRCLCHSDGWVAESVYYRTDPRDPICLGSSSCGPTVLCAFAAKDVCHRQDVDTTGDTMFYARRVKKQCCKMNASPDDANSTRDGGGAVISALTSPLVLATLFFLCGIPSIAWVASSSVWRRASFCECLNAQAEVEFIRSNVRDFKTELIDLSAVVDGVVLGTIVEQLDNCNNEASDRCGAQDAARSNMIAISPRGGDGGGVGGNNWRVPKRGIVVYRQERESSQADLDGDI